MMLRMEYVGQPVKPYFPRRWPGYFDAFAQNPFGTHDNDTWASTLAYLRTQKGYLEDQLWNTATTLNVLRNRQTRNDRDLSMNPRPRSKKKQILQKRWRTDKTIKTSENEERVILDCLQVCMNNIHTLEVIIMSVGVSPMVVDNISNNSFPDTKSSGTEFDWNGWSHEEVSPFHRACSSALTLEEIPPEVYIEGDILGSGSETPKRPLPMHPGACPTPLVFTTSAYVYPDTVHSQVHDSILSPDAACFEPSVMHSPIRENRPMEPEDVGTPAVPKVKKIGMIQRRRFSDAPIGQMFDCLPHDARSVTVLRQRSWAPETQKGFLQDNSMGEALKRKEIV